MGICFFCPNGHPLNVKSDLAGKVGYCPKCRVKMRIPLQSMRDPHDKIYTGQPTAELVGSHSSPDSNGEGEKHPTNENDNALDAQSANIGKDFSQDSDNEKLDVSITGIDDSVLSRENEDVHSSENLMKGWKLEDLLGRREVLWYVISSEGQKYGPATGDILKKWVNERRIGPKMHLWCSLWKSSLEAGDIFPELIDLFGEGVKEKDNNLTNDLLRQSNSSKEEYILKTRGDSDSLKYDIKRHKQKVTMSLMLILSWILTMLCVLGGLIWFVVAKSH